MSEQEPVAPEASSPAPAQAKGISLDWIAVGVAAIFALAAIVGFLPEIPWDTVNLPTIGSLGG